MHYLDFIIKIRDLDHLTHLVQNNNKNQKMLDNAYHHADQVLRSYQQHPLYIGDISAAEDIEWLKSNRIGVVMTVASGFNLVYDHSIAHIRYDLQDSKNENIGQYFDECSKQIERYLRSTGVLVHCGAGVSRSSTVIIAYLIKYKGMTFAQALKFLKSKRPQVCPNLGFQLQLKSYEAKNNLSKNLLQRKHFQKSQQLPGIVKMPAFHTTTYNKSFGPVGIHNRNSNQNMNKKERTEIKEKQYFEYLRKMAEFRFGITNMSRWRIGSKHENSTKKGYDF